VVEGKLMFEQAVLPIQDEATYTAVRQALDKAFAPAQVSGFLARLGRARLRARQFEAILASGLLGEQTPTQYAQLGDSDRGHVREEYLSMVEKVAPELRAKHLKVYAYY
jgi:hypothetical protein